MDLFEKIDLFEKMASQLLEGTDNNTLEDVDSINKSDSSYVRSEAMTARLETLKKFLKG